MSTRITSAELIATLQAQIHQVLAPLVPKKGDFALLDFPDHGNVGDSAIWLGEMAYFKRMHRRSPAYVCGLTSLSVADLEKALPEGAPIFLSGGGNFGDLWPAPQLFREKVLSLFPKRPVIQLPQSIHFANDDNLRRAAYVINAHPNFTLLVRDRESLNFAREHFSCRVELCADMAFCLGPIARPGTSAHPLLLLMRTDKEKAENTGDAPAFAKAVDWLKDEPDFSAKMRRGKIARLPALGTGAFQKQRRKILKYNLAAENRLKRGIDLLSSAKFVITDRLHAHILSVLLNLPHIALDNSYRKLGNFLEAWTKDCGLVQKEDTLAGALKLFREYEQVSAS